MIAGRYTLDREIGRGGMGAVWLGSDEVLGRPVAIKRVGLQPGGTSPDLVRAEREAKISASLNHPHIVGVFDLVDEHDQQWLVMEYVEGTTLAEMIRTHGPLPDHQVAPILAQAASALAAAHENGIVHRDVKPSNILVRADGQVKLTDFGIARSADEASMTRTGLVTGSPAYLAPEVASGQQANAASDVWSLGATLYHALSGHAPYEVTENVLGALYRIVHEEPPQLARPSELEPVRASTMAKDPEQRWTMAQVVRFLDETDAMAGRPATALPYVPAPVAPPVAGPSTPADQAVVTRAMTQVAPPRDAAEPPAPPPAPPRGPVAPGARRSEPARRRVLPILVGMLVLALVVAIVVLALQDDPQPGLAGQPDSPSASASSTPPEGSPSPSESPTPPPPTRAELRSYVADYLDVASSDPGSGFEMLTPAFQEQSPQYDEFWGSVSNPRLLTFTADPQALTVSYTYRYQRQGLGRQVDDVQLRLVRRGSSYLIDGPA